MADIKISGLPAASEALGSMQFEVNNSGTSERVTGSQIQDMVIGSDAVGFVVRTGTNAVAQREITAGEGIVVENTDGVDGNPKIHVDGDMYYTKTQIDTALAETSRRAAAYALAFGGR